jgi:hypothetical protein
MATAAGAAADDKSSVFRKLRAKSDNKVRTCVRARVIGSRSVWFDVIALGVWFPSSPCPLPPSIPPRLI